MANLIKRCQTFGLNKKQIEKLMITKFDDYGIKYAEKDFWFDM